MLLFDPFGYQMSTVGQPITCKAAIAWAPKEPLIIETIEVAPPKAGEVRIKVLTTAVCHTDIYTHSGADSEGVFPAILGHEACGVIESVGEGVTSVSIGDVVVPLYIPECRACKFCKSGKTNLCSVIRLTQGKGLMPDGTTRFTCRGTPIAHYMGVSAWAEFTVVPEISVAKVNGGAPETACLFGCGVSTGYGAVVNTCKVGAGATAAVFGLGGVGLAVCMGLRDAGARRIFLVDLNPAKFDLVRTVLAAGNSSKPTPELINVAPQAYPGRPIQEVLVELSTEEGAGGVDYAFECVGSTMLMRAALESCHKGWGEACIIGVAGAGQEISTRPFQLVTGRVWKGSAFGGMRGRSDLPGLVARHMAGDFPLDAFVTHKFTGVEAIPEAMHVMHEAATTGAIRPVVTM